MGDFVSVEQKGAVAILRLNRPDSLNAVSTREDCDDLVAALNAADANRELSALILTGNGRAFCAGGDLKAMKERRGIARLEQPDSTADNYRRGVQSIIRAMLATELPTIAAINGHAIGLGLDLACLCDIRIGAESAKYAASFIKVGLVPGDGGAWTLQQIVGYSRAAELFLTGDRFDSDFAKEIGLISRAVADDSLIDEAFELADRIAANPARVLRLTKRLLQKARQARMDEVLELSAAFQALAHETADHGEAVDAFIERRDPNFTGN